MKHKEGEKKKKSTAAYKYFAHLLQDNLPLSNLSSTCIKTQKWYCLNDNKTPATETQTQIGRREQGNKKYPNMPQVNGRCVWDKKGI